VVMSPPSAAPRGAPGTVPLARPPADDEAAVRLQALRAAGMKPSSEWENAGRATPTAAFETMLWAWHTRDYDVLATLIGFNDAAKAKLDAWFAALPASVRAKFGTPERAIAPAYAEGLPPFSMIRVIFPGGLKHEVGFKFVPPDPIFPPAQGLVGVQYSFRPGPETSQMWQAVDGWKISRWVESTAEKLMARIDPATGELLPENPQPAKP
jgi:hypothetical protein